MWDTARLERLRQEINLSGKKFVDAFWISWNDCLKIIRDNGLDAKLNYTSEIQIIIDLGREGTQCFSKKYLSEYGDCLYEAAQFAIKWGKDHPDQIKQS